MNIRNKFAHQNSFWDWSPLNECFGATNIRVTDIDGFVERKGRFLVIETKKPGEEIPQGQSLTFAAMADTGLFTIIVIWGKHNAPEQIGVITRRRDSNKHYQQGSVSLLQKIVSEWFNYADQQRSSIVLPKSEGYMQLFNFDPTASICKALGYEGECCTCGISMTKGSYFRIADGRIMHLSCVKDWESRRQGVERQEAGVRSPTYRAS